MTESLLIADMDAWLRSHARGHERARPRKELLAHLCALGHWPKPDATSDRAMRKAAETMECVGSCSKGYFFIVNAEDRKIALGQLHSQAMSELVREKRIREAGASGEQGELF